MKVDHQKNISTVENHGQTGDGAACLAELGDVPVQELSGFIEKRHGVKIEWKFIPIFKLSLRDKLRLEAARQEARAALEKAKAESQPRRLLDGNLSVRLLLSVAPPATNKVVP